MSPKKRQRLLEILIVRGGTIRASQVLQFIVLWVATLEAEGLQSMSVDDFVRLGGYYSRRTAFRRMKTTLELLPEYESMDALAAAVREQKGLMVEGRLVAFPGVVG